MDLAVSEALASVNDYLGSLLGASQNLFDVVLTGPGISLLLFSFLLLCVLGTASLYSWRLRELSQHLRELSEIMQEQSRAVDSMRRTLEDALDVLASLDAASHYTHEGEDAAVDATAALLRQELESLRAEILADAGVDLRPEER